MLSIIDKEKKKRRFCQIELERMQAENVDTVSEKFLALKPGTNLTKNMPNVLWADFDNIGKFIKI